MYVLLHTQLHTVTSTVHATQHLLIVLYNYTASTLYNLRILITTYTPHSLLTTLLMKHKLMGTL